MRDHDRGQPELALQPLDLDLHVEPQILVERGERLVEQQELGLEDKRARQRHALLLAAGELARIAAGKRLHLHGVQHLEGLLAPRLPGHAPRGQPIGDVLGDAHMREQRVVLEHDADLAPFGGNVVDGGIADDHACRLSAG